MANIKISELNALTERADNDLLAIVDTSADETKKIQVSDLVNKNIELIAVSDTAPSECSIGDKYYNTTNKEIYTATGTNTWSETGTTPISGILYIVYNEQASYSWDGTDLVSVGGGKEDIVIDDEEPTDPDVKLWIDTGEVQNYGSEIHIGKDIDNRVGLNILTSKNLFDKNNVNVLNAYFTAGTTTISQDSNSRVVYLKCNSNTTYTISKVVSSRFAVGYATTTPAIGVSLSGVIQNNTASSITITTGNNAKYICIFLRISSDTLTLDQILDTLQVEVGSTATSYESFNSTKINVDGNNIYNEGLSVYSTNEQIIGTWMGKPLYRRTYDVTLGNTTRDQIALSGLLRDYNIIKYDGEMYNESNDNARPLTQYYVYNNVISYSSAMFFKDNTTSTTLWVLNIWHSEAFAGFKCRIIVEYTKPTD